MPNLRGKKWTTTTPANVEDAQYWEDHLLPDEGAPKTKEKVIFVNQDGEVVGEFNGSIEKVIEVGGEGHKILNALGQLMHQRRKLRFLSAEVTDDEEENVTIIDCKGEKGDKGSKGDKGDSYVLTEQDRQDIADMAAVANPSLIKFYIEDGILYMETTGEPQGIWTIEDGVLYVEY